jgi:predicted nucleic acid-binding protein
VICLDTNIFIYLANSVLDPSVLPKKEDFAFASVTKIESLGYHNLTIPEADYIQKMFDKGVIQIDLSHAIISRAIRLRQLKKIGLGDAIVAATALENDIELWTANTKDFEHIDNLKLHNPMKGLL